MIELARKVDAIVTNRLVFLAGLIWLMAVTGAFSAMQQFAGSAAVAMITSVRPAVRDWRADRAWVEGNDLILSGTLRKVWQCDYQPPPRVASETGQPLFVQSLARNPDEEWPAGETRRFGPWRIVGGAGHQLTIYFHHRCWGIDVFTKAGLFDATAMPPTAR